MADMEYRNGALCVNKLDVNGNKYESMDDIENRYEILLDSSNKIISCRKSDGILVENAGIETSNINSKEISTDEINISPDGMVKFQDDLKASGFNPGGKTDWSDYLSNDGDKPLHLPIPTCARVNISNNYNSAVWPGSKTVNYEYFIEYWDMLGNYFKKNIIFNAQGNSSLGMPKKNGSIDLFDSEHDGDAFSVKFGNWVPQDSFHLKAYYTDYFVGACPIGYKLFDQIQSTRDIFTNRDWKKVFVPSKKDIGTGCDAMAGDDDKYVLDNDARCFPDGFPCIVYLNGEFWGIYSWQIKKHRDNYQMSKKKPKHIHLDGCVSEDCIFLANGNINWDIFNAKIPDAHGNQDGIEIRNPKPKKKKDGWELTCVDGTVYNGDDNMEELIGEGNIGYDASNNSHVQTNNTKKSIINLSTYIPELIEMETPSDPNDTPSTPSEIKEKIAEHFDIQSFIDYLIFGDIITNFDGFRKNWQWITYDGKKWFVEPYDLDGIFGWDNWGPISPTVGRYGNDKNYPTGWIIQYYQTELETRYKELRDLKILSTNNIISIFRNWISSIGVDNYNLNHKKWPIDRTLYPHAPVNGHFDNIYRVSNWLDQRLIKCDEIYNYTN